MPRNKSLIAAAALILLAGSVEADDIRPPDTLVVDGAPAVPADLALDVGRYTKSRAADLQAWHPTRRELLIVTRFGETVQIHRVSAPGGARTQITFFDDDVNRGIAYEPNGASILFSKDRGGDGNYQIYRIDA